jgi:eukaryotic-like serine/threonine-protein kinase
MQINLKKYLNTVGGLFISIGLTVAITIILFILYFYTYLPNATNHGETITVPNIEGMSLKDLEFFLGKRNLRYEVGDSSYAEEYPPLTVLKQYPHAGAQVKENRVIYLSVNRVKPPTVPLPDLVDGSLINAEAVLKGNELKRGKVELVNGPFLHLVKEMKFNGHTIFPGTRIPKGSVIDLVVEDGGNNTVTTPDLLGYTLEDAKVPIFGSNLILGTVYLVGDTTRVLSVVLKQKPAAGETIRVGDIVELWIGKRGTPVPAELEVEDETN